MNGVVHPDADGDGGDDAGEHVQVNAEPPHHPEVDHHGGTHGHQGEKGAVDGSKPHQHNKKDHSEGEAKT